MLDIGAVCIASWGSYNACNETEATLGVWVDFNDFEELSEIEEHLKNRHGFDIDGIDEELFIIDDDNGLYPYDADLASAWERYEILKNIDINILKILSDSENIRSMDLDELEKIGDNYIFYSDYTFNQEPLAL